MYMLNESHIHLRCQLRHTVYYFSMYTVYRGMLRGSVNCGDITCLSFPLPSSVTLCALIWLCRWNEINNMSHNRSFFALELTNREESVQFQTVSLCYHHTVSALIILIMDIVISKWIEQIWIWSM